ncbi:DUF885 domain-containing protein [Novosphingobium colocasiae]|uniref:DUF885 domain-containing protein n=1 Tax=Novosphingobium colocasiae TaxID=1256513 RepID=A0A918PC80_9SPHN|nr:DUF885 domain-containing protein [Novosphingobium colocasiae]GGY96091.1 hypothetical protein GCM10011614_08550 [Novosphingobium colocasiae]
MLDLFRTALLAATLALTYVSAAAQERATPAPHATPAPDAVTALRTLFDEDAQAEAGLDPLGQILRGELPEAGTMRLIFTDELDREHMAEVRDSLSRLNAIPHDSLPPSLQLAYDAFAVIKQDQLAMLRPENRALTRVRPFNHFGGLPIAFPALFAGTSSGSAPSGTANAAALRNILALYAVFPEAIDNAILRFREGMAAGVVEPRRTVELMISQIDMLQNQPLAGSAFLAPLQAQGADTAPEVRAEQRRAFEQAVTGQVRPAYARLRRFLAETYLPAAREQPGLWAMPGGDALYRQLVAHETGLALDPEQVHQLGLSEVARIRAQMDLVRRQLGYAEPLDTFFATVRTDPRFHPRSAGELAQGYAAIGARVDGQLPALFHRLPVTPLIVQPYPDFRALYEPGGSYSEGDPAHGLPGVFFYNTSDLPHRFLSGMTTLYLHEAMPGHHLQLSLAAEDASLAPFQRQGMSTAFVEGWALYAETLGYRMGLYADPLQHWGTLDDEMLRAMRLVVDTGLHVRHWTRDQAVAYMLANSGMGRQDAETEVDRYIALPAQALSYKIGALTIQRLRDKAESRLGPRFDIRDFHEQVLGSGALPLPVLEEKLDRWIDRTARIPVLPASR